jgi:hypothetical protein
MWDLLWPHLVCRFKSNPPIVLIDTVPLQTLHFNINNVQNVTLTPPYQHRQVQKCRESGPYWSSENLRNVNSNMLSLILHLHQRPRYLEAQPNPTQTIHDDFLANLCWRIAKEEQSLMLHFKQALPTIMNIFRCTKWHQIRATMVHKIRHMHIVCVSQAVARWQEVCDAPPHVFFGLRAHWNGRNVCGYVEVSYQKQIGSCYCHV